MTARSCQLSATPVRYPRLRQRASALGHVCTSARHTSSRRGRTSSRLCRTSRPRQSRIATSHLVPHIRDIWSGSARDRPFAASRGSSERSLREFVNDYTAVLAVPFYIANKIARRGNRGSAAISRWAFDARAGRQTIDLSPQLRRRGRKARTSLIPGSSDGRNRSRNPGWPGPAMPRMRCYVPPVGVEPTLGTLLGGRPLPLGYGGFMRIPRTVPINARAADYYGLDPRSISPIQFLSPGLQIRCVTISLQALRSVNTLFAAARALQASPLPSAPEHSVQHALSHPAGKGVLLARVVATDE